ncbi:MAG: response regulator [Planctomycetes bacterium]|nr:response regulator [Planctomycetota bacterium]
MDDNEVDLRVAGICYEKSKLCNPLLTFSSGEEFVAYMESDPAPFPAMVMLDINMPGLCGFDVLEHLRSREEFREIPVILMFTHSDDPADMSKSTDLGANGFITKPSSIRDYVEMLNEFASTIVPCVAST